MFKLDLHIHSCYSKNLYGTRIFMPPSTSKPKHIIKTAIKKGLNAIAVTDHDNLKGSLITSKISKKYDIIVLKGSEISSKDGHILAYCIEENIPPNLPAEETLELIKEKNGFPVIPHPFNFKYSLSKKQVLKLRKKIGGIEVYNSHSFTNGFVKDFADKYKIPKTAGSDAHSSKEIGYSFCKTDYPINKPDDIIKAIRKNKLVPCHNKNSSIIFDIIPNAVKSFSYWKIKQIHRLINRKVFLPF